MAVVRPTVFVLDDDPAIRDSLSVLLQGLKLPAEFFSSTSELIAAFDRSWSGCLLLDVRIPGDGMELLKRLTDSESSLPIIVITGHGSFETKEMATELGAVAYFEKPFDPEELGKYIRQLLDPKTGTS